MKRLYLCLSLLGLSLLGSCTRPNSCETLSPDAQVRFVVEQTQEGALQYRVFCHGEEAVGASNLGLVMDGQRLGPGMRIARVRRSSIDENYTLKSGKKLSCENRCN